MAHNTTLLRFTPLALALAATPAFAQTAPDAGQLLQQQRAAPTPPKADPTIQIAPPASAATLPGGAAVTLKAIRFAGNSVISSEQLGVVLGDVTGKTFDLAGLQGLALKIGEYYRANGYPFARAYVPEQTFADGVLEIVLVEGRYGQVKAEGDTKLAAAAQGFLSELVSGSVIATASLERSTLILSDQPGIRTAPLIRPGQLVGTGDLTVAVTRTPAVTGDVGLENYGNRYTGQNRAHANVDINSPFMLGDQISIRTLVSDAQMWLGSLGYSLPLGSSGLRGNVSYAHTSYTLGKDFASLQANGTASVASAGLSYPLIRSQATNLTLSATYQDKDLKDNQDTAGTKEAKTSRSLPITLQFDKRDTGGGGITYGSLSWTPGTLNLDANLANTDASSGAQTKGSFNKLNLDVVRLQALGGAWSFMGRLSTQWASKNLDSSEKMSLGGANGVRAYPCGEATGDDAWLTQLELRYQAGVYAPYVFMDAGGIKPNAKTDRLTSPAPSRNLAGAGVGLRYQRTNWNLNTTLAWRTQGGVAQSDTSGDPKPRVWVSLGYQF